MDSSKQVKLVWYYKSFLESRDYNQSQVYPCLFYRKESVILTYVDDCVILSHKQETITSLIESIKNGPENYVLTDEGYIYNYFGDNMNKNLYGAFELSQVAPGGENNQLCWIYSVCKL